MKVDRKEQHNPAQTNRLLCIEPAQGVYVRSRALDYLAGWGAVVVAECQALDMVEHEVTQAQSHTFGCVCRQAPAKRM